ncbi:hypothetical protein [Dehalobacter sp. TeCB1]|uniref:hypothetical protein n=1 Tax=Dehalobacter sp. TeCB1 TaxID=1843715 RepID=UPI00083A1B58|nr:hypothetical protein [Dehalobacter sp. TeCB1]OCZ49733.1 hypothetical protein A7D23_02575 [Dehalobacter sp. TeCB1]
MLDQFTTARLQKALDICDEEAINTIMPLLFGDYDPSYSRTLISYNNECDIKVADLISFKKNNPPAGFISLFLFDEDMVKIMCNTNMKEYFANRPA